MFPFDYRHNLEYVSLLCILYAQAFKLSALSTCVFSKEWLFQQVSFEASIRSAKDFPVFSPLYVLFYYSMRE